MPSTSKTQAPFAVPLLADHFIEWYQDEDTAQKVSIAGDYVPPVDEMADILFAKIQGSDKEVLNFLYDPTAVVADLAEYPDSADPASCHYLTSLIGEVMERIMDEFIHPDMQDWIVAVLQNRRGAPCNFKWGQFCNDLMAA